MGENWLALLAALLIHGALSGFSLATVAWMKEHRDIFKLSDKDGAVLLSFFVPYIAAPMYGTWAMLMYLSFPEVRNEIDHKRRLRKIDRDAKEAKHFERAQADVEVEDSSFEADMELVEELDELKGELEDLKEENQELASEKEKVEDVLSEAKKTMCSMKEAQEGFERLAQAVENMGYDPENPDEVVLALADDDSDDDDEDLYKEPKKRSTSDRNEDSTDDDGPDSSAGAVAKAQKWKKGKPADAPDIQRREKETVLGNASIEQISKNGPNRSSGLDYPKKRAAQSREEAIERALKKKESDWS